MSEHPNWLVNLRSQPRFKGRLAQLREIAETGKPQDIEGHLVPVEGAKMMLKVYEGLGTLGQEAMALEMNTDFRTTARKCSSMEGGVSLVGFLHGLA